MTVWAEQIFLLNAGVDYALLAGAVRLRGGRPGKRLIAAALLGGVWSLAALLIPMGGRWMAAVGFCLLTGCAYGISADGLRHAAVFLGLSLALCGIQAVLPLRTGRILHTEEGILLQVTLPGLAASAALLYGAASAVSGAVTGKRRQLVSAQVTAGGHTVAFRSLLDTGSFLRDPLTGRPVLLADSTVARLLLRLEDAELRDPAAAMERLVRERPQLRPRMIPYRAIGVEQGMLLGIRCDAMRVGGRERQGGILAFAPGTVSEDGSYHGLTGGTE